MATHTAIALMKPPPLPPLVKGGRKGVAVLGLLCACVLLPIWIVHFPRPADY